MTTVAFRFPFLASDSAVNANEVALGGMKKIFRLPSRALVGFAGYVSETMELLDLLRSELSPPKKLLRKFRGAHALVVHPDGEVWMIECENGRPSHIQIAADYHAIGSGRDIALGAMAAGASARRAVLAAAKHDMQTRLPIQQLRLST